MDVSEPSKSSSESSPVLNPLSPSVNYRKDEKNQLANLNNRLAIYVEKVRSLELQNSYLQRQLSSLEENSKNEVENVKALFEGELKETRKLLDEISKKNAQLQLESQAMKEKNKSQKNRIKDVQKEKRKLEEENKKTSNQLDEKTLECTSITKQNDNLNEELAAIRKDLALAFEEIQSLNESKKAETLRRVDAENQLESVKEELQFKEKVHQEEVAAVQKRHSLKQSAADKGSKGEYDSKLEAVIMDLREQQHTDLEMMKEELEDHYEAKICDLSKQLDEACATATKAQQSGKLFEIKVDRLQDTIKTLQSEANDLENKMEDLEGRAEVEKQLRITAVQVVERERDEAREMIARMEKEYNDLLDTNLQLDHEISVYRKLLEEEEQRLNLSPSVGDGSEKVRRTRTRKKRKQRASAQSEEETSKPKKRALTSSCKVTESSQEINDAGQEIAEMNKSCSIM